MAGAPRPKRLRFEPKSGGEGSARGGGGGSARGGGGGGGGGGARGGTTFGAERGRNETLRPPLAPTHAANLLAPAHAANLRAPVPAGKKAGACGGKRPRDEADEVSRCGSQVLP